MIKKKPPELTDGFLFVPDLFLNMSEQSDDHPLNLHKYTKGELFTYGQ